MSRGNPSPYYPVFLNIGGRKCVVVGGGRVAWRKVQALVEHGASVEVVSPDLCAELGRLAERGMIQVQHRDYARGDLADAVIAVAATGDGDTNERVAEEARGRGVLVNVVDEPGRSDFIVPSCLRRGDVCIAVSTGGRSPALARRIRARLEEDFAAEYASLALLVAEVRSELKRRGIAVSGDEWQQALDVDRLIGMLQAGRGGEARAALLSSLEKPGRKE